MWLGSGMLHYVEVPQQNQNGLRMFETLGPLWSMWRVKSLQKPSGFKQFDWRVSSGALSADIADFASAKQDETGTHWSVWLVKHASTMNHIVDIVTARRKSEQMIRQSLLIVWQPVILVFQSFKWFSKLRRCVETQTPTQVLLWHHLQLQLFDMNL